MTTRADEERAAEVLRDHRQGQQLQRGAVVACWCGEWVGPWLEHADHQAEALTAAGAVTSDL